MKSDQQLINEATDLYEQQTNVYHDPQEDYELQEKFLVVARQLKDRGYIFTRRSTVDFVKITQ